MWRIFFKITFSVVLVTCFLCQKSKYLSTLDGKPNAFLFGDNVSFGRPIRFL